MARDVDFARALARDAIFSRILETPGEATNQLETRKKNGYTV